ncbi:MAG: hypothetical protein U0169_17760 [Polyangiaceae bacterium]
MTSSGAVFRRVVLIASTFLLAGCPPRPKAPAVAKSPRTTLEAPRVEQGAIDLAALLGDFPERATKLGASPHSIVASGEAGEGERMGAFVEVPLDVCVLAYARGSTTIEDLDLAAFSDEGSPLVIDESSDAHPTLVLCPPHPERVYLASHVANGEGLVVVAAHIVPKGRAAEIGRAFAARGGAAEGARPAEAWPGIDDVVRAHRDALGGTWEEFRKVAVTVDPRASTFVSLPLRTDQCVDAVVLPDDEVGPLEVEALDDQGRMIARAKDGGRNRSLTLCSPLTIAASLAVRPHAGRGLAAVVLARGRGEVVREITARADVAWVAAAVPVDVAKKEWNDDLASQGYGAPYVSTQGTLVTGRRSLVTLDPKPAAAPCARIDVVAGAPLALLDANVWDDSGSLLTSAEGAASATVFSCQPGKLRLDLETRGRPGPFAVLARSERWADPSFASKPVAAARMLQRAASGLRSQHGGTAHAVKAFVLEGSRASTWNETVPAGKCLRVAAGSEGPGLGLTLRLFDAPSQEELDRSHAPHAVSARACASSTGPRTVAVELRATSGRVDVVVGERME